MAKVASCKALLRVEFWERVDRIKKESRLVSSDPGKRRSTVRLRGNKREKPSRFARTGNRRVASSLSPRRRLAPSAHADGSAPWGSQGWGLARVGARKGGVSRGWGSRTPPVTSAVGYERWLSRPNGSLRLRSSGGPRASSVSSARACATVSGSVFQQSYERSPHPWLGLRSKELADPYAERVPLEDIFEVSRDHVGRPERFAAFHEYLCVRHWLAHGRYGSLKTARKPEPLDVSYSIRSLLAVLPGFPAP